MYHKTVGLCRIDDGKLVELNFEAFGQGVIYKNWKAFFEHSSEPCYCPEAALDSVPEERSGYLYGYGDFLRLSEGDSQIAEIIFSLCDWQCPETELDNLLQCRILAHCVNCGCLFVTEDEDDSCCSFCQSAKVEIAH